MSDISSRIKKVRSHFGLSQRAISERIGGNHRSWQEYETGKSIPGGKALSAMAALGVSIDWLLTGEGSMFRQSNLGERPTRTDSLDQDLLKMIIEELEEYRSAHNFKWDNEVKSRLIALGYAMMLAEREKGNQVGPEMMRYLMQAAS